METESSDNDDGDIIQIVDAKALLTEYIILGCFSVIVPVFALYLMFGSTFFGGLFALLIGGGLCWAGWLTIQSSKDGYIIDIKNDSFSFPGGRAADDVSDYFDKDWILQRTGFKRAAIELSTITRISQQDRWEEKWSKQLEKYIRTDYHEISIEGTFGTITKNLNKGKRDQLYSMLQQTLNMGTPINVNK